MRFRFTSLWRNYDFLILWVGGTVSGFGSQITFFALPMTAINAELIGVNYSCRSCCLNRKMLPSFPRLLVDAHGPDVHRSHLIDPHYFRLKHTPVVSPSHRATG